MDFFPGNVFEYFKERRMAGMFFGTLLWLGTLLIVGFIGVRIIRAFELQKYATFAVPVLALLLMIQVARVVRQAQARRRDRYKISPLSRDELTQARSKLLKR